MVHYLITSHVFGINGDIKENIFHLDDSTIAYCAGSTIVISNIDTKMQKIVTLQGSALEKTTITAMAVNQSKKVIAIAEKTQGAIPLIHIYDYNTLRKKKTITSPLQISEAAQV